MTSQKYSCCWSALWILTSKLRVGLFRIFSYIVLIAAFTFFFSVVRYEKLKFSTAVDYNNKLLFRSESPHSVRVEVPQYPNTSSLNGTVYSLMSKPEYSDQTQNLSIEQYYKDIGANVTSMSNLQLFNDLMTNSHVDLRSIYKADTSPWQRSVKDVELARIRLTYASFSRHMPLFISERERELFMQSELKAEGLVQPDQAQLVGEIAVLYLGRFDEHVDCGWKNKLSDYLAVDSEEITKSKNLKKASDSDIYVPLLVPDGMAFQHFTDGILPKIAQIAPFLSSSQVKIVIQKPRDKIILEMLEKLGFSQTRLVFYAKGDSFFGNQLNTCITPPLHPGLWRKIKHLLGVKKSLQVSMAEASVVLLTRTRSRNGGRKILNGQEVINYLRMRYNTTFSLFQGGYNLAQSQAMFEKARVVLGVHGGAFYNINFCPVETIVVEYVPMDEKNMAFVGTASKIVWAMADMNGQKYYRVAEKPIRGNNLQFSITKLKQLLDEVDRIQLGT